ncbi:E3 ubiquitin-protein ligase MIB2-like [Patella vulgata]|uniref:E3 ubiquitin-protein ligase MIB2-like n=1 Tax=Patella vulgata TaxID=6465 RepID=UPI0024A978EB|nr:E3 ubiquitin-protein ligase MIB2-like [Patella vulgata]
MSTVGTRVIRGPDWAGKSEDSGAGSLGTVVAEYHTKAKVKVVWDVGNQGIYKAGADGKHELYIYDNAPTGVIQNGVACDSCKKNPIVGIRWKCRQCHDFDLCTPCYMKQRHSSDHTFLRYMTEVSTVTPVSSQGRSKKIQLHGILPGSDVTRGLDWEWGDDDGGNNSSGTVEKLTKWGSNSYRGGVRIKWSNGIRKDCRIGGDGRVDLTLIGESTTHHCFPELLPVLDITRSAEDELKIGDKVIIMDDAVTVEKVLKEWSGAWNATVRKYIGEQGTVIDLKGHRLVVIQYRDLQKWTMFRHLLVKTHSLKEGDLIRIIDTPDGKMEKLQKGHGGWNSVMTTIKGKPAKVERIDKDRDIIVKFLGNEMHLNPVCCDPIDIVSLSESELSVINEEGPVSTSSSTSSSSGFVSGSDKIQENIQEAVLQILQMGIGSKGDLVAAAAQGDLTLVQKLVKRDPSKVDNMVKEKTALQMACYKGHKKIVEYLISNNASPELADSDGDTPLHLAVSGQQFRVVKILCEKGVNVNQGNKKKQTPFHLAICHNNYEIAEYLVSKDCNVNTQDEDGDTPLHEILDDPVELNDSMINMMLSLDSLRLDIKNGAGFTAIHSAILNGIKKRVFERLIKKVKKLDSLKTSTGNYTPLHIAAVNAKMELAAPMIKEGHAVDVNDDDGRTPLHLAVIKKSEPMIDLLLANNADINSKDNNGDTPAHLSVTKVSIDQTVVAKFTRTVDESLDIPYILVLQGARLDIKNRSGKTPLDLIQNVDRRDELYRIWLKLRKECTGTDCDTPFYWKSMKSSDRYIRVELTPSTKGASDERERILNLFNKTSGNRRVIKLERIQNIDRWEAYAIKKKSLERSYGVGLANERHLFHGTKPEKVESIISQGLDCRLVQNGLHGDGAYFALESKLSDGYTEEDDDGNRYIFVAKVLVGKSCLGKRGMKRPTVMDKKRQDTFYDSAVDSDDEPRIFVLFDNSQIYVEYLITYR